VIADLILRVERTFAQFPLLHHDEEYGHKDKDVTRMAPSGLLTFPSQANHVPITTERHAEQSIAESTAWKRQRRDQRSNAERHQTDGELKSKDKGGLTLKVSEKGGVSLYGMGRFPVTLYKEQWLRIFSSAPEIEAFIRVNDSKLKTKE